MSNFYIPHHLTKFDSANLIRLNINLNHIEKFMQNFLKNRIIWKNPDSWDIWSNVTSVAVASSWSTVNVTALTSSSAKYIYLLVIGKNSNGPGDSVLLNFRENGQSNDKDNSFYNQVANKYSESTFWQKMDSSQNFQVQTGTDGETVYMRCIAYME